MFTVIVICELLFYFKCQILLSYQSSVFDIILCTYKLISKENSKMQAKVDVKIHLR